MDTAERWPLDYDSLEKGQIIPADHLERITKTKRDSSDFAFAVLKLKDRIEKELNDRGKNWTIRSQQNDLKVLTDSEAATYNHAEQVRARRAMQKRFALAIAVDITQLDDEQRKQHERNIEVDGKFVAAMRDVQKQLTFKAHRRNVPALSE